MKKQTVIYFDLDFCLSSVYFVSLTQYAYRTDGLKRTQYSIRDVL